MVGCENGRLSRAGQLVYKYICVGVGVCVCTNYLCVSFLFLVDGTTAQGSEGDAVSAGFSSAAVVLLCLVISGPSTVRQSLSIESVMEECGRSSTGVLEGIMGDFVGKW